MLGLESDNQITYYAGPIKITICGWSEKITLSTTTEWDYLLDEAKEIAIQAWELDKENIIREKNKITIKTNYNTIKLYIEHSIILT